MLPPRYAPYTIDEAIDCRDLMLEVDSCADDTELAALIAQPAGSPCTCWLPVWLPIAHDGGGNHLFVDLRPGLLNGCIMEWDEYEAAVLEPRSPSTATMLAEIADALEHGTDIKGCQPEACNDGTLDWV